MNAIAHIYICCDIAINTLVACLPSAGIVLNITQLLKARIWLPFTRVQPSGLALSGQPGLSANIFHDREIAADCFLGEQQSWTCCRKLHASASELSTWGRGSLSVTCTNSLPATARYSTGAEAWLPVQCEKDLLHNTGNPHH